MQGSIYIYAMDGTPLVTGEPVQAMAINSKIGIVTGLTLGPIKKVIKYYTEEDKLPKTVSVLVISTLSLILLICCGACCIRRRRANLGKHHNYKYSSV